MMRCGYQLWTQSTGAQKWGKTGCHFTRMGMFIAMVLTPNKKHLEMIRSGTASELGALWAQLIPASHPRFSSHEQWKTLQMPYLDIPLVGPGWGGTCCSCCWWSCCCCRHWGVVDPLDVQPHMRLDTIRITKNIGSTVCWVYRTPSCLIFNRLFRIDNMPLPLVFSTCIRINMHRIVKSVENSHMPCMSGNCFLTTAVVVSCQYDRALESSQLWSWCCACLAPVLLENVIL